jgi:hypothetical protein
LKKNLLGDLKNVKKLTIVHTVDCFAKKGQMATLPNSEDLLLPFMTPLFF